MKIEGPGLALYKLHNQYNSHSQYPICECGLVKESYIKISDIKGFPIPNLVGLGLYGPRVIQALVFGILAADSPKKFTKLKKELKNNPIIKKAEKDAKINKKIGNLFKKNNFRFIFEMRCDSNGIFHKTTYLFKQKNWDKIASHWDLQPVVNCCCNLKSIEKKSKILGDVLLSNIAYKYYKLKKIGVKTGWSVIFKSLRICPNSYSLLPNIKRRIDAHKINSNNKEAERG